MHTTGEPSEDIKKTGDGHGHESCVKLLTNKDTTGEPSEDIEKAGDGHLNCDELLKV